MSIRAWGQHSLQAGLLASGLMALVGLALVVMFLVPSLACLFVVPDVGQDMSRWLLIGGWLFFGGTASTLVTYSLLVGVYDWRPELKCLAWLAK